MGVIRNYESKFLSFNYERRNAIKTAKELQYDEDIIHRLKKATTPNELGRILKEARTREED